MQEDNYIEPIETEISDLNAKCIASRYKRATMPVSEMARILGYVDGMQICISQKSQSVPARQ